MVEKRIPIIYSVIFSFCVSIMTILMILLFIEYRFFCEQVHQLSVLKEHYAQCIGVLHTKINGNVSESEELVEETPIMIEEIAAAESSDAPDNDDEYADDSFVIINRQPDYLKQSTLDYMESQELNVLMTAIDIDRWSEYTPAASSCATLRQAQGERGKDALDEKKLKKMPENKPGFANVSVGAQKQEKMSAMRRASKDCGFIWPIDANKFWLSSLFGPRKRIDGTWGFHHGIDMAAIKGTAVKAVRAGTVVEASFQAGYGNTVLVKHTETLTTRYAHLHTIRVYVGQKIKQGAVVGTVGETGFIRKKGKDGSHLHFEVYERGKRINPMPCLPRMT